MYFTFINAPNIQYQSNFFDSGHDFYFMKHVGITLAMLVVDVLTRWVMHKGIAVPVSIDVALTLIAALTLCSLLLRHRYRYNSITFSEVATFNFTVTFVTSIFYGIFMIIYTFFIDPFYVTLNAELVAGSSGILRLIGSQTQPVAWGGLGALGIIVVGSAWTPLLALMLRRKSQPDDHYNRYLEHHSKHPHKPSHRL